MTMCKQCAEEAASVCETEYSSPAWHHMARTAAARCAFAIRAAAGDRVSVPASAPSPVACLDCGTPYAAFPLDTTLPDDQWRMIHDSDGGILCASCMVKRAAALPKIIAARMTFEFAPSPGQSAAARGHARGKLMRQHAAPAVPEGMPEEMGEPAMPADGWPMEPNLRAWMRHAHALRAFAAAAVERAEETQARFQAESLRADILLRDRNSEHAARVATEAALADSNYWRVRHSNYGEAIEKRSAENWDKWKSAERALEEMRAALLPISKAYPDDPGTSDLDNEQPVTITLGDVRRVWRALSALAAKGGATNGL